LAANLAIGNPVAFDASAELRDTRGFISITTMRPSRGLVANWMLDPPVSTPTARMIASAASRMRWYSRSDRVWIGATVIESPVWTPIGSKFSIEQTITTLSFASRITSSSNSFQPSSDSSIEISEVRDSIRPRLQIVSNSASVRARPPPDPPMVNDGRIMHGRPMRWRAASAASQEVASSARAMPRPRSLMMAPNFSRLSARMMTSAVAPIIAQPNSASVPSSLSAIAVFSAVCPPRVGRIASGRSRAMIFRTVAGVIGSMYVASAISGSVMIVAGFEFTRMVRNPSWRSTLQAWVPE
jgi:hypothetical protein